MLSAAVHSFARRFTIRTITLPVGPVSGDNFVVCVRNGRSGREAALAISSTVDAHFPCALIKTYLSGAS